MDIDSFQKRVLALSAEAKRRTTKEMWRVRSDQAILPRLGKTAVGCVLRSEAIRLRALNCVSKSVGNFTILGHGAEQIVMADGPEVVKLLFGTIQRDRSRVIEFAQKLQLESDICNSYLSGYWLPTKFYPITMVDGIKYAVVARQERLENPILYKSAFDVEVSDQRRQIAENILMLHEDTGLLPDLMGSDNIARRVGNGALCQIDTIPVGEVVQAQIQYGQKFSNGQLLRQTVMQWL